MSKKAYEELKILLVEDLKSKKNESFVILGKKSYTRHEIAAEVEKETPLGLTTLKNLILLAADLVNRGKERL